jgi:hypothetical protein
MSTIPPPVPPAPAPPGGPGAMYPPPPPKKTSPIVWVLVGLGAFLLLVVIAVVGAGFFLVHKVKQAGLDPELMRRNPGLATVKMMAALNPNIEVLSVNENRGLVTVRDKQSGKTYSVDFEDAKKGKFIIKEDGKDAVTVNATGDDKNGSLEVKSGDSTVKIGGGQNAKVPTWIPDYPGSTPQAAYSAQAKEGDSGMFTFKTKDPADKVAHFYEEGLKSSGMKTSSTISNAGSGTVGGMISGEDESRKHSVTVLVGSEGGETTVTVNFSMKK